VRPRLAAATVAACVVGTLALLPPAPALAVPPDCAQEPTLPLCQPEPEPNHDPYGALTEVTRDKGIVTVRGRAADDDAPDATVLVSIAVDGQQTVYAGASPGFDTTVVTSLVPGDHVVCADAINIDEGTGPVRLGCLHYTTPAPVGTPAMVALAVSSSRVDVEWATTDDNAAGFRIGRNFGAGWTDVTTLGPDVRTYAETGLAPDTPVCIKVSAFNDFSEQVNAKCTTTLHAPLPAFTQAETSVDRINSHAATVHWVDSGSPATHYRIELFRGDQLATELTVAATERSFRFLDLMEETDYRVRVSRYNPAYEVPADRGPPTEAFRTPGVPKIIAAAIDLESSKCGAFRPATVSFTVRNAVRVTVAYDKHTYTSYGSAGAEWSDHWPVYPASDWTYVVTAYNPSGEPYSVTLGVPQTPFGMVAASGVDVVNRRLYPVRVSLHGKDGYLPLGTLQPGQRATWTMPRCQSGTITALDVRSGQSVYVGTTVYFGDLDAKIPDVTI